MALVPGPRRQATASILEEVSLLPPRAKERDRFFASAAQFPIELMEGEKMLPTSKSYLEATLWCPRGRRWESVVCFLFFFFRVFSPSPMPDLRRPSSLAAHHEAGLATSLSSPRTSLLLLDLSFHLPLSPASTGVVGSHV